MKDATIGLNRLKNKRVRVVFLFRKDTHYEGVLRGLDSLGNLVLDETVELPNGELTSCCTLRDDTNQPLAAEDAEVQTKRQLGLVVARGPLIRTIAAIDGAEYVENPFGVSQEHLE